MSPVAVGNSHTRTISVDGARTVNMRANGKDAMEGWKNTNRVFAHLEDLLSVKPDIGVNSSLKTILAASELSAKQADTQLEFRRPDIALTEYVKASIIVVDTIPRHKDFPSMKTDRVELYRHYTALTNKINSQHSTFVQVKELIRENNLRNGTSPLNKIQSSIQPQSRPAAQLDEHIGRDQESNPHQKKVSPPVLPKPDGLHGNALPQSGGAGKVSDLAARFARLQNNGIAQDPRIKTQPISTSGLQSTIPSKSSHRSSMVRPLGPREPPSSANSQGDTVSVPLHVSIPGMPRPPDAIHHSPLRAADHSEVPNLPSSVVRAPSYLGNGRSESAPPISTVGPSKLARYVKPEQASKLNNARSSAETSENDSKRAPSLPNSSTISAEELMEYLKQGQQALKLLLVDIRDREAYDSGHILSHSVICVEPVTLRSGISGEELEDSMIIATSREQDLFEQRHEFDLVVFYDQSTVAINASGLASGKTREDKNVANFVAAVWDYGYDKRLSHYPVMLSGGLDAWVDLLGPNCLQSTAGHGHPNGFAAGVPLPRSVGSSRRLQVSTSKRKARASRLKSSEEEEKWTQILRADPHAITSDTTDSTLITSLGYARTTDDFFRKYPEVSVRESMISSSVQPISSYDHAIDSLLPQPPARPAPALPRSRSSGITNKSTSLHYAQPAGQSITATVVVPGQTGLHNNGNMCYLNSAVQFLAHAPVLNKFFRELISKPQPVPQKAEESRPNGQIMSKCLSNLFIHLSSGQYSSFDPKTFRGYVNALHCNSDLVAGRVRELAYGGVRQHDSGEFLDWLWRQVLNDEMNINRDVTPIPFTQDQRTRWGSLNPVDAAVEGDQFLRKWNDGFLVEETGIVLSESTTCLTCNHSERIFDAMTSIQVTVSQERETQYTSLIDHIVKDFSKVETREMLDCDKCGQRRDKQHVTRVCRLPNTFIVYLSRGVNTELGDRSFVQSKNPKKITIPEFMDLSALFEPGTSSSSVQGSGFNPPHQYRVRAATQHIGPNLSSGHYVTYARTWDDRQRTSESWYRFDDSVVTTWDWDRPQQTDLISVVLERVNS